MIENSTYKNSLKEGGKRFLKGIKWPAMAIVGLSLVFSACSSDDLAPANPDDKDLPTSLNLEVALSVPMGTRSETNSDGESHDGKEAAKDIESAINTLNLYLCNVTDETKPEEDELIYTFTSFKSVKTSVEKIGSESYSISTLRCEIDPELFSILVANKKLRLYFVANAKVTGDFSPNSSKLIFSSLESDGIGSFETTGISVPLVSKDANSIVDFSELNSDDIKQLLIDAEDNVLNLNTGTGELKGADTIVLERAVARVDYKDRNRGYKEDGSLDPETYAAYLPANVFVLGETWRYVKIVAIKMVNVAQESFVLRHSTDGTFSEADGSSMKLFGIENGFYDVDDTYRWIADSDWP